MHALFTFDLGWGRGGSEGKNKWWWHSDSHTSLSTLKPQFAIAPRPIDTLVFLLISQNHMARSTHNNPG